jgi:hypothetical protein
MAAQSAGPAELALLRRLAQVGGRYTFRPDGENLRSYRAFEQEIVSVLLGLHGKQLVQIDPQGTEVVALPGQPGRFAKITAEIMEAGRAAIR